MKRFNQDDWDNQATPAQIKEIGFKADQGQLSKRQAQGLIWGVNPWMTRDSFSGNFLMLSADFEPSHRDDVVDLLFRKKIKVRSAAKEIMAHGKYSSRFEPSQRMYFREITPRQLGFSKGHLSYESIMNRWLTLGFLNVPPYMAPALITEMNKKTPRLIARIFIHVGMLPICRKGGFDHIFYWTLSPNDRETRLEATTCIQNVIGSPVAFDLDDVFIVRIPEMST